MPGTAHSKRDVTGQRADIGALAAGNDKAGRMTPCQIICHVRFRHLVQFGNKHRTHIRQPVNNCPVMHNLVPHIDGRAEFFQRDLDNADGTVDTGTKAARCGKVQIFALLRHVCVFA